MAKKKTHKTQAEIDEIREHTANLRAVGLEVTEREVEISRYISNAVEAIVAVNTSSVDGAPPAHPEMDTRAARQLFDTTVDRYVPIRTLALARAVAKISKMHISDERRAGELKRSR